MLLRHAKAEAHAPGGDFERALTPRGAADAGRLGAYLRDRRYTPDVTLVSAARRTMQTFDLVRAGRPLQARFDADLFDATAGQLRDLLRIVDPSVETLMIVGHNPGLMEAAILLSRDGDLSDLDRMRNRFPPCTLAVIVFDTDDWLDARAAGGRLDRFVLPEDLAETG